MGNDFFGYLARLEIMVYFAGYPIIYALVYVLSGEFRRKLNSFLTLLPGLLPMAYALSGTLFLGYMIKKIYIGYGMNISISQLYHPLLILWGLLSLLFWLKPLRKITAISLVHSLVFFYFIPRDIYLKYSGGGDNDMLRNDMNILTFSLLLNAACLLIVAILHSIVTYSSKRRNTSSDDKKII
jgi:hypothetical protein